MLTTQHRLFTMRNLIAGCFSLWVIVHRIQGVSGILCFECSRMTDPHDCLNLRACQDHELCYLGQRDYGAGGTLFEAKCETPQNCDQSLTSILTIGKRADTSCTGCCSTDYCNRNCSALDQHPAMNVNQLQTTLNPVVFGCKHLDKPNHGDVMTSGQVPGSVALFTCLHGYTLDGPAHLYCLTTGQWSEPSPTCRSTTVCEFLAKPIHGDVVTSGQVPGSVATFTCLHGYTLDGPAYLYCLTTGQWNEPSPTCRSTSHTTAIPTTSSTTVPTPSTVRNTDPATSTTTTPATTATTTIPKQTSSSFPNYTTSTQRPPRTIPPNPTLCFVCTEDLREFCDQYYVRTTCDPPNNYCINYISNKADGSKSVNRTCGNFQTCYKDWYEGSSDSDKCQNFRGDIVETSNFECTYCCIKDNCNEQLHPTTDTLYTDN